MLEGIILLSLALIGYFTLIWWQVPKTRRRQHVVHLYRK